MPPKVSPRTRYKVLRWFFAFNGSIRWIAKEMGMTATKVEDIIRYHGYDKWNRNNG
jgi:hypothetical protein